MGSNNYYLKRTMKKKGKLFCDECGKEIKKNDFYNVITDDELGENFYFHPKCYPSGKPRCNGK
jgi:hypothetical protein